MKRTTYIMMGLVLAGLALTVGLVIHTVHTEAETGSPTLPMSEERKSIRLPECRVVRVMPADERTWVIFDKHPLLVRPAEEAQGTFTYNAALEKYLTMEESGDTVDIVFNFPTNNQERATVLRATYAEPESMTLTLPASVEALSSELCAQVIRLEQLRCDTLSVSAHKLALNDCHLQALHISKGWVDFESGSVERLHLDIDELNSWNVNTDSVSIGTEYLYATSNTSHTVEQDECRQIVWQPAEPEITLDIRLKRAARIEIDSL